MREVWIKAIALAVLMAWLGGIEAAEPASPEPARPQVEVVFVLDTTGSMGGLIQAAKEKIWAIANTLASAKPAPDIKMGLVGYRDRGDAYVTKQTDLTDDLDAVYEQLMAFQADGGGDTPESVNQALNEAVTKINWSKGEKAYKVIFLVGDCPPHMDYADDVKYPETCQTAAKAGIVVNTIQCGSDASTEPVWKEIAGKAEGRYFRVEQSGGAILASTPFDGELAELSKELEGTRVAYGDADAIEEAKEREEVSGKIHAGASVGAKASRAVFLASKPGESSLTGSHELVRDLAEGRVKLADVKDEELPEELRKMSRAEREKFIAEKMEKRKDVQSRIEKLAASRQKHIEEQLRKSALQGKQSLDFAIFDCIKEQAGKKGIVYKGGPAL
jgi:uncharacterized protein YegL